MPIKDPAKRAAYHKRYFREIWYPANKHKHQIFVRRRTVRIKEYLNTIKLRCGCFYCKESNSCCLDFHHRLGRKEANLAHMPKLSWSWRRIDAEVAKCKVVCSNCHRKIHAGLLK